MKSLDVNEQMLPGQSADEAFPGMFHWDCMGN